MKVKEFEEYRAMYCGLCKQLQKSYGAASRLLLNYDLVLVAILADAVSGEHAEIRCEGCFVSPFQKRCTGHCTAGLTLAADGLVILSYHKLIDNLADESFFKKIGYRLAKPLFSHWYKRAAKNMPQAAEVVQQQMVRQAQLEAAKCSSIDEAADPTAKMCEAIFGAISSDAATVRILARLGLFAGQIVYLLDAAEDYDEDAKTGSYNVFLQQGLTKQEALQAVQMRCRLAAGEIALCYNLLDIKQHKAILDNVFFLGIPTGIVNAGVKRTNRRPKHGQINSL